MNEITGPQNAPPLSGAWPAQLPGPGTPHSLTRPVRYLRYRAFYNGEQWEDAPAPGERRITFNYARVFCNKAASYLLGRAPGYDVAVVPDPAANAEPPAAAAAPAVEAFLAQVAAFNALAAADLDTAISAATLGDGAWTVRWDAAAGLPRVTGVDPSGLDARWRADDLRTLLWLRQSYWLMPAEMTAAQQAALDQPQADPYAPLRAEEEWTPTAWRLRVGDRQIDGGPNVYGVIPYVLFPNLRVPGEFWGESDLADLLGLQRELNSRFSLFSRILEVAGNPVAVVSGVEPGATESLRLGPNQLWTLPEGARAEVLQLLQAGGAAAHFKYIEAVYRAMHDVSEMPRTSFGDSAGHGTTGRSGVALQIELQPLLHKLARKRAILSGALERRAQLILAVARVHGVALPPVRITVQWPPVLPQDRTELVAQEVSLVQAGIHPPTAAMAALGDPDPAAQWPTVIAQAAQAQAVGLR